MVLFVFLKFPQIARAFWHEDTPSASIVPAYSPALSPSFKLVAVTQRSVHTHSNIPPPQSVLEQPSQHANALLALAPAAFCPRCAMAPLDKLYCARAPVPKMCARSLRTISIHIFIVYYNYHCEHMCIKLACGISDRLRCVGILHIPQQMS